MIITRRRLELYEDNGGGLHIACITDGSLDITVYHHIDLAPHPDATDDALAILTGDTSTWTTETIDDDTSIFGHPETRCVAEFRLRGYGDGGWELTGERLGSAARAYLGIPEED